MPHCSCLLLALELAACGAAFQSSDAPTVVTWACRFETSGTGPAGGE
jgi:hypothetical protein